MLPTKASAVAVDRPVQRGWAVVPHAPAPLDGTGAIQDRYRNVTDTATGAHRGGGSDLHRAGRRDRRDLRIRADGESGRGSTESHDQKTGEAGTPSQNVRVSRCGPRRRRAGGDNRHDTASFAAMVITRLHRVVTSSKPSTLLQGNASPVRFPPFSHLVLRSSKIMYLVGSGLAGWVLPKVLVVHPVLDMLEENKIRKQARARHATGIGFSGLG